MKGRVFTVLTLLAYAALGAAIYSNVLAHGVFVMDDHDYILHNPSVQNLKAMLRDFWELRYVGYLTFALNYARAGLNPVPYHWVNAGIHLANAFLAYLLTWRLSLLAAPREQTPEQRQGQRWLPFFAGLLFLVHPIQTSAASYISQRFTALSALFYIGACLAYLGFRSAQEEERSVLLRRVLYGVSLLMTLLAMKTKEISFTIPVMLLFAEAIFFGNSRFGRRRFMYAFPHAAVAAIIPLSIFARELGPQH